MCSKLKSRLIANTFNEINKNLFSDSKAKNMSRDFCSQEHDQLLIHEWVMYCFHEKLIILIWYYIKYYD